MQQEKQRSLVHAEEPSCWRSSEHLDITIRIAPQTQVGSSLHILLSLPPFTCHGLRQRCRRSQPGVAWKHALPGSAPCRGQGKQGAKMTAGLCHAWIWPQQTHCAEVT